MKEIDFTKNYWGHAIHPDTFRQEKSKLWDFFKNKRRYSVMVHSSQTPCEGDFIIYKSAGGEKKAKIYKTNPCGDPKDMFTIFIEVS